MAAKNADAGGGGAAFVALLIVGALIANPDASAGLADSLAGATSAAAPVEQAAAPAAQPAADPDAATSCALARWVGLTGEAAVVATAVAAGESAHNDAAVGDEDVQGGTWAPSIGRWQIRGLWAERGTGAARDPDALHDPGHNALAMHEISAGGTDWQPWGAFTNGSYREHLESARAACG